MTTFTYTRDIPDGPHNPSADQQPMKVNTNSIDDLLDENHYSFGIAEGGKHLYIQMPEDVNPSTFIPGSSTGLHEILLYNGLEATKYNLYFIAPNKTIPANGIQLTRNESPTNTGSIFAGGSGYSWLPGGFIIQWGTIIPSPPLLRIANGEPVLFPFTFANVFSITISPQSNSTDDKTINITTGSVSVGGFTVITSGSSSFQSLSWMAIGN